MRRWVISLSIYLALFFGSPAFAGFPVFDSPGWLLKLSSLYKEIKQLQIMQKRVEAETAAALRMIKRFKKWQFKDFNSIDEMIRHINSFNARTRSIGYTYDSIADQFESFYGKKGEFKKNYRAWEKQSDDSIKDAMVSQGLVERSRKHMTDLDDIVKEKRDDHDQEATLQAIGDINAVQSRQLADLSEVIATDARAKQSVVMEERSKQKAQQDYEAHLMKDFNTHQKSRPMTHFPSLGRATTSR